MAKHKPVAPAAPFAGFPEGKTRLARIPAAFFTELLPQIDHLAELKLTIYAFWRLEHVEGKVKYLRRSDLAADERFMAGLVGDAGADGLAALDDALGRAVRRGTLLQADLSSEAGANRLYLLNSPRGRAALRALQAGDWAPEEGAPQPLPPAAEPPNLYRLYEENIGPLTPLIADALREAEEAYPAAWFEEAFRIAVENNVRRWRYVEAILRAWKEEGRDEPHRGDTQKDRRRYVEGEFSDSVEH